MRNLSFGMLASNRLYARTGLTLIEIIVVLILLGLAAALVAPVFILPDRSAQSELGSVIDGAQRLASRRGESMHLHVTAQGEWRVEGVASPEQGDLAQGRVNDYQGFTFTLVVSPLGTCGFDPQSTEAARVIPVDPLTCQLGEGN